MFFFEFKRYAAWNEEDHHHGQLSPLRRTLSPWPIDPSYVQDITKRFFSCSWCGEPAIFSDVTRENGITGSSAHLSPISCHLFHSFLWTHLSSNGTTDPSLCDHLAFGVLHSLAVVVFPLGPCSFLTCKDPFGCTNRWKMHGNQESPTKIIGRCYSLADINPINGATVDEVEWCQMMVILWELWNFKGISKHKSPSRTVYQFTRQHEMASNNSYMFLNKADNSWLPCMACKSSLRMKKRFRRLMFSLGLQCGFSWGIRRAPPKKRGPIPKTWNGSLQVLHQFCVDYGGFGPTYSSPFAKAALNLVNLEWNLNQVKTAVFYWNFQHPVPLIPSVMVQKFPIYSTQDLPVLRPSDSIPPPISKVPIMIHDQLR